jgi:peptidoglycan/xylan/chitin deacetylase (PgdA/CDA1 family)
MWPDDIRCPVMLTFDLDGRTLALNRNPDAEQHPTVLSMSDFGPKRGVWRILDLLDEHEIPASFFIPGYIAERNERTVREIVRRGHEVGHHGYMHEPPASLDLEQEIEVIDRSLAILQGITGEKPVGYRSPSWDLSVHTLDLIAERGFAYDSSMMDDDLPYVLETKSGPLVELPVHWFQDDAPYFWFHRGAGSMNTPQDVLTAWEWEFDGVHKHGGAFMLTCHPQISGHLSRIVMLDKLIRHIKSHPGARFMRCAEVATIVAERES